MNLDGFLSGNEYDLRMHERMTSAIRRRGPQVKRIDDVLDAYGCRAAYRDSTKKPDATDKRWITDISKLAHVLRVMKISADELIDRAPAPFADWRDGSRILFILGKKENSPPDDDEAASVSQMVSDVDLGGHKGIVQYFQQSLYMRLDFENWEAGLPYELARPRFDQILDTGRADLGAVIVLGSPAINPAAEVIGEKILGGAPSPCRFRFNRKMMPNRGDGREPLLWHPEVCEREEEGIHVSGTATTLVRKRAKQGTREDVQDCGVLLMSIGLRTQLILAAGHGALGTLAASFALTASWKMNSICTTANQSSKGSAYALVEVDKLDVGEQEGEGWRFV